MYSECKKLVETLHEGEDWFIKKSCYYLDKIRKLNAPENAYCLYRNILESGWEWTQQELAFVCVLELAKFSAPGAAYDLLGECKNYKEMASSIKLQKEMMSEESRVKHLWKSRK